MSVPEILLNNPNRRSMPILNKFERSKVLGKRAEKISMTGKTYLEDQSIIGRKSPEEIAMMELNRKLIPYVIQRRMPDATHEYWDLRELDITY